MNFVLTYACLQWMRSSRSSHWWVDCFRHTIGLAKVPGFKTIARVIFAVVGVETTAVAVFAVSTVRVKNPILSSRTWRIGTFPCLTAHFSRVQGRLCILIHIASLFAFLNCLKSRGKSLLESWGIPFHCAWNGPGRSKKWPVKNLSVFGF